VDADPESIVELIGERCPECVTFSGWRAIDEAEQEAGKPHGRPRIKFCKVSEMVEVARGAVVSS
jgi:ferredoxin--NADP+ reductase